MLELDEQAPDFTIDSNMGKISLSDFRGKWVVLFAYPADFTPICEVDIIGFARSKARFDDLGVQFIGWSVDTCQSHAKWISEIKERTGVEIPYPLIADVDKKLAERYGILHETKGVTYRGVFIIDPDGTLRFIAIYPLDVGRSIQEVERIIKSLQRARELTDSSLVEKVERVDEDATRIIREAENSGVTLRLMGGIGIRFHCHGTHSAHLRKYHDIDVFGLGREREHIVTVFDNLGYSSNVSFNSTPASGRLQFISRDGKNVDVFLEEFRMQHALDFSQRIRLDDLTIPITDLLLTKLQIGRRLEAKDANDIVAILEDHDLGHSDDKETLNVDYMADLCARNWGLYTSVTYSLQKVRQFVEGPDTPIQCTGMEASEFVRKLDAIRDALISRKKGFRWRTRSLVGERVKWYQDVEVGVDEAY